MENINEKNPIFPVLKLENKIDLLSEEILELYKIYNSIINKYNENSSFFKIIFETEVKNNLEKVDNEINKIKTEIETSKKELESIVERMEMEN